MNLATVQQAIALNLLGPSVEVYRPEAPLLGARHNGVIVKLVYRDGFDYPEWAEVQWRDQAEVEVENLGDLELSSPMLATGLVARLREGLVRHVKRIHLGR